MPHTITSDKPSVYLVDASIYIFRAWFSVPDSMRGENDIAINAVYGFTRFLTELVERSKPTHVGIAFDESLTKSFRNELYPAYKMNRELPPADLENQFKLCRRVAQAAGFYCVGHSTFEADDLIATMALSMREQGYRNVVVSADKDLTQLLRHDDLWWDFARNQVLNSEKVTDKFGVPPTAIQDYLGLCGDKVDNIPGVPGIGPKTASALLQRFGTVEGVYQNLEELPDLPIRGAKKMPEKLLQFKEQAHLSKELATVHYQAPIDTNSDALERQCAELASFKELGQILGGRGEGLFQRLIDSSRLRHA